jgi:hypothetical protein
MSRLKLRDSIATEAARLVLRGKETEYAAARRRAARWLSRRKLDPADMPSDAEIHSKLYTLAGLFADKHQIAALSSMRQAALELMDALAEFQPRLRGCAVDGPVTIGSDIAIEVSADSIDDVLRALSEAGFRVRAAFTDPDDCVGSENLTGVRLRVNHLFPCEVTVFQTAEDRAGELRNALDINAVRDLVEAARLAAEEPAPDDEAPAAPEEGYHPDTFAMLRVLLLRLKDVQLDPSRHPEGDALYHSLQVFELGRIERSYDEEFLLACVLHDVGLGIDRRDPVSAALAALEGLLTERTCFLIEHRAEAREYLKTGKLPRSLRRSEHFDELVLLAQCDLKGRVRGAEVSTVDEALDYIAGLATAWDDA